ncbi:hypothetical protein [Phyllobacterium sp. 628]|nr:hypothetical protein [Phyllobacterium sp. 628]
MAVEDTLLDLVCEASIAGWEDREITSAIISIAESVQRALVEWKA